MSFVYPDQFDVLVIGGGHAGVEAALAASRMGADTCLLTQAIETIGQMSCNPAIGGIGKSHLVKEIDALGGAMAVATDEAGIQFRTLNATKGPAVQATRAQTDRVLYKAAIRKIVENQPNLKLWQDTVVDLLVENDIARGVVTRLGMEMHAKTVILTTGTFLGGRIFVGSETHSGGRAGDSASIALADRLRALPLRVGRLKTGTPPRIDGKSVDFSVMDQQPGDQPTPVMSFLGSCDDHPRQVPCHITHTNGTTHELIRGGLSESPMYSGKIEGVGPRYCPSIEDKVVRFADRDSHQIFVEPEGLGTTELYPNGISTSLPYTVQVEFVRSIRGFEHAHITRAGYAIEYDFFDARDLGSSLETKVIENLFFAGQINGTTGYEEAGVQGLVAGINAALKVDGKSSWCPQRHEGYGGVLIDDLITLGTDEPYRMFTSRAEYRLRLRQDNADFRLTPKGRELGLVDDQRWNVYEARKRSVDECMTLLKEIRLNADSTNAITIEQITGESISKDTSLLDFLRRPNVDPKKLLKTGWFDDVSVDSLEQAAIEIKYDGYIERQERDVAVAQERRKVKVPENLQFNEIEGLSNELQEKLIKVRPETLSQAARIPGMTPSALSLLAVHIKRSQKGQSRKIA